jgi:hypothetical protein
MDDTPLPALVFPIFHVIIGAALTYYTVAGFVNTTTVELDRSHLTIRHAPLPWRGGLDLDVSALRQLYCEEHLHRSKNGPRPSYTLSAVLKDGSKKKLLADLDEADVPRYLEQQVEAWLGLRDAPVAGQMTR